MFTEVLHHVVALRLAVDKEIQANLLLEVNNRLDLLLDELVVLLLGEFTLGELGTSLANLLGLLMMNGMSAQDSQSNGLGHILGRNQ